jgi:TPR repeat protein
MSIAPASAAMHMRDAARGGDAAAQATLGQLYLDGHGVPRDAAEGFYWFQEAAHRGVPMAMNMVGRCHENGWGTQIDHDRAAAWYRRAADHGLDWGFYNLAHAHARGRGVAKDVSRAYALFAHAASMGHARAMYFVGHYCEHGLSVPVDLTRACALYKQSSELGDYRGRCAWASVLAGRGQVVDAAALLQAAIPDAPAHFLEPLAGALDASPHPMLHDIATQIRASGRLKAQRVGSTAKVGG